MPSVSVTYNCCEVPCRHPLTVSRRDTLNGFGCNSLALLSLYRSNQESGKLCKNHNIRGKIIWDQSFLIREISIRVFFCGFYCKWRSVVQEKGDFVWYLDWFWPGWKRGNRKQSWRRKSIFPADQGRENPIAKKTWRFCVEIASHQETASPIINQLCKLTTIQFGASRCIHCGWKRTDEKDSEEEEQIYL